MFLFELSNITIFFVEVVVELFKFGRFILLLPAIFIVPPDIFTTPPLKPIIFVLVI